MGGKIQIPVGKNVLLIHSKLRDIFEKVYGHYPVNIYPVNIVAYDGVLSQGIRNMRNGLENPDTGRKKMGFRLFINSLCFLYFISYSDAISSATDINSSSVS